MSNNVRAILTSVSEKLELINRDLEKILPTMAIKDASSFGNSSHVVLSKSFLDKKVGIIVLDDVKKSERRVE